MNEYLTGFQLICMDATREVHSDPTTSSNHGNHDGNDDDDVYFLIHPQFYTYEVIDFCNKKVKSVCLWICFIYGEAAILLIIPFEVVLTSINDTILHSCR